MIQTNTQRFIALYNLINLWNKPSAQYYLSCIDQTDYSLITQSILMEMECTLIDVIYD